MLYGLLGLLSIYEISKSIRSSKKLAKQLADIEEKEGLDNNEV